MDATPLSFDIAAPREVPAVVPPVRGRDAIAGQWVALQDAAAVVAALAGVADEPTPALRRFPDALRQAAPGRLALAEQGVEDLTAIMTPGLAALLAVHRRGGDASAPACALWQEFVAARAALIGFVVPAD
jgi:hypothetical protein